MRSNEQRREVANQWWSGERQLRLSAVPHHVPYTASGRPVSLASVYRWTTAGMDGVRLRRFRVAGQWATTVEELARWQQALTEAAEV